MAEGVDDLADGGVHLLGGGVDQVDLRGVDASSECLDLLSGLGSGGAVEERDVRAGFR